MVKTIFVGDKPSPRMKPGAKAFDGAVCYKRLIEWVKYLNAYPSTVFNRNDIELIGWMTLSMLESNNIKFIALGNKASDYLKDMHVDHFKLPHPSGRNRKLNNKKYVEEQLELALTYLEVK